MKDYPWKLAERYPNHEKHMSLRDGVEMEVEGHGDRWAWNVRTVTGAYIAKDGKADSLRDAKAKAEGVGNGVRILAYRAYEKSSNSIAKERSAAVDYLRKMAKYSYPEMAKFQRSAANNIERGKHVAKEPASEMDERRSIAKFLYVSARAAGGNADPHMLIGKGIERGEHRRGG